MLQQKSELADQANPYPLKNPISPKEEDLRLEVDEFLDSFEKSFKSTSFEIDEKADFPKSQSPRKDEDLKMENEEINKIKFYKELHSLYPSESSKLMLQNSLSLEFTSKNNFPKGSRIDQNDTCYDQIEQILNNISVQERNILNNLSVEQKILNTEDFIVVNDNDQANLEKILESSINFSKNQLGISPSRKKLSEFLLLDSALEKNFTDSNNLSAIEKTERKNIQSPFFKKDAISRKESLIENNILKTKIEKKIDSLAENKENENNAINGLGLIPAKFVGKESAKPLENINHLSENDEKMRTKNCIIY
jgi:hypothetical protein